jgi:hypothetical protein
MVWPGRRDIVERSLLTLLTAAVCVAICAVALAQDTATTNQGTVIGTVEVHYQAAKGLLGKMSESTRSRKWLFRVAKSQDGGAGYREQARFEVREGGPHPFSLTLPAGSYRLVDAENRLSGGVESQSAQLDTLFEVRPGETVYVGRLLLYVRSVVVTAAVAVDVADCRDVDLALIQAGDPAMTPTTVAGTTLLRINRKDGDGTPPPFPGCGAPRAP